MMKHCRAAPHGTWHQETGTLACLLPLASLWRTTVMNIILNVVKGQLRDIPCCSRYFLVNVLKIVNGRKYLSFKTFVRQQRTDTVWGRAGCGSGGLPPCPGKCSFRSSEGQRQWKGLFSGTWTRTLLQSTPSGCNCESQEGGREGRRNICQFLEKLQILNTDTLWFPVLCPLRSSSSLGQMI